jgi:ATP-dependent Lhr-like helicase
MRLAILNAGTIPDRGLYGVFLAYSEGKSVRVGELDEEMVFESSRRDLHSRRIHLAHRRDHARPRAGYARARRARQDAFLERRRARPAARIRPPHRARWCASCALCPSRPHSARLVAEHDLDPGAAENLLRFLADQEEATGSVPDDRTIVIERCRDELGDWRVCVLTPFGSRIHIPWAMAVSARIRAAGGPEVETLWGDDGFVLRFPDTDEPPDSDWFLVESAEAMALVLRQLGHNGFLRRPLSRSSRARAAVAAPPRRCAARHCGSCASDPTIC